MSDRAAPFWIVLLLLIVLPWSAGAIQVVGATGEGLSLAAGSGTLLKLDRPAETVFVAEPEIADIHVKSPTLVYLIAKKFGTTTVFAVDAKENVIASMSVSVRAGTERLDAAIRELHPDVNVTAKTVGDAIVLQGRVLSAGQAEDIRALAERLVGKKEAVVNRIEILAPMQVNLRVRVAEISRDIDKQLGFNWSLFDSIGGLSWTLGMSNPFAAASSTQSLSLSGNALGLGLNAVLDALEDDGLAKVLAEPNLTAMSGETASFLAGGEFPILVPDSNGRVTVSFKKFGVSLAFTPTVLGEDRIALHVRPEVSEISNANSVTLNDFQVPSLATRRAETTVELGSGQSFAIAGLLQSSTTHDVSRFPGLADIPVLGTLFKSDSFQRSETELVIMVTPYLVRPVSHRLLASPTDGYRPPHDTERFQVGGVYRRNPNKGAVHTVEPGGRPVIGPVGFQFE